MFLDDKLLKLVVNCKADKPEDIQKLYKDVMNECQDYYKAKISPLQITAHELKVVLNKTFNLYDSFVRMALKHDEYKVKKLGELFQKHTFKMEFMKDDELAGIYNSL